MKIGSLTKKCCSADMTFIIEKETRNFEGQGHMTCCSRNRQQTDGAVLMNVLYFIFRNLSTNVLRVTGHGSSF